MATLRASAVYAYLQMSVDSVDDCVSEVQDVVGSPVHSINDLTWKLEISRYRFQTASHVPHENASFCPKKVTARCPSVAISCNSSSSHGVIPAFVVNFEDGQPNIDPPI